MAQHTVTAGCGHTVAIQLYGPATDRQRRLDWMRSPSGMCHACYSAHKRMEEQARTESDTLDYVQRALAQYRRMHPEERIVAISRLTDQIAQGLGTPQRRAQAQVILDALKREGV